MLFRSSREAIAAAQTFAQQYGNAQVDQIHLLYALADQEGGLIRQLLQKMDVDPDAFVKSCEDELNRMPKVSGSGREMDKIYITADLDAALNEAEALAGRMKDEYTSVEHLFLGLMDRANSAVKRVLDAHRVKKDALLRQMQAVRGNTRVDRKSVV